MVCLYFRPLLIITTHKQILFFYLRKIYLISSFINWSDISTVCLLNTNHIDIYAVCLVNHYRS